MPSRVLGYKLFWKHLSMKLTFKSALKMQLLTLKKKKIALVWSL